MQGTDRPDRANTRAPAPQSVPLPPPPKEFTKEQKRAWLELAALVDPLRVASRADVVAFGELARCLEKVRKADAELQKAGGDLTYEKFTEGGVTYAKRPQVEIIATFTKLLDAKLARFGLTPAEREKVSRVGDDVEHDPLDEFALGGADGA